MKNNKFKKLMALSLAAGTLGAISFPAFAASYTDVSSGSWYNNFVNYLSDKNVVTGYPDNTFRAQKPVTRAEFATMIAKSQNLKAEATTTSSFRDVPASHWASATIEAAVDKGWLAGYPNSTFRPNQPISLAEMYAVMAKVSPDSDITESKAQQILSNFSDSQNIPSWAVQAVATAVSNGTYVKEVTPTQIEANIAATRADVATSLAKLLNPDYRTMWNDNSVASSQTDASVQLTGELKMNPETNKWEFMANNGKTYQVSSTPASFDADAYQAGQELKLSANVKMDADNMPWLTIQTLNPVSTTAQAESQTTIVGQLTPTTEAGGWVITTENDGKKYLLTDIQNHQQKEWFKAGTKVRIEGELRPDTMTSYMEGTPFTVIEIEQAQ